MSGTLTVTAPGNVTAAAGTNQIIALGLVNNIDWTRDWQFVAVVFVPASSLSGCSFELIGGGITVGTNAWAAKWDYSLGKLSFTSPAGVLAGTIGSALSNTSRTLTLGYHAGTITIGVAGGTQAAFATTMAGATAPVIGFQIIPGSATAFAINSYTGSFNLS